MQWQRLAKIGVYHAAKWCGLFSLSRWITGKRFTILAYHQCSGDTVCLAFDPSMFISPATLGKRLAYLERRGFSVVTIDTLIDRLARGEDLRHCVAVTVDDGWFSTQRDLHPVMRRAGMPYTVYVTSYYAKTESPLFNHVVRFMFWKTAKESVSLAALGLSDLADNADGERISGELARRIIAYGHTRLSVEQRNALMRRLGDQLGVPYAPIAESRIFSSMNAAEIAAMAAEDVDIQLHTYHHRWPRERESALREIRLDRAFLEPLAGHALHHFCYPSGDWAVSQIPYLREADIRSATTCDIGMNDVHADPMTLKRFLDHEGVHQIEFEAELSGFTEILRLLLNRERPHSDDTPKTCG